MPDRTDARIEILRTYGADPDVVTELLAFGGSPPETAVGADSSGTVSSEPFVPVWRKYAAESKLHGVFATLQKYIVQLRFPIQNGLSTTSAYRDATLRGNATQTPKTSGLVLAHPENLSLFIHSSMAGDIPV